MEEHARRYTTNQDNILPKHISDNSLESAWLFFLKQTFSKYWQTG